MSTPTAVLEVARAEVGTVESPRGSNRQKYGAWYGLNGQPWCAVFVAWCFDRVGINVRKWSTNWAYTPAALQGMRNLGMVVPTRSAQPGDIVFFDFPDAVKRTQHVGIVESVTATGVVSIEGNTGIGNDSNGGAVMRRERPWAHISGMGRPPWTSAPTPTPAPPTAAPSPAPVPSSEDDVKIYALNYSNRVEYWLGTSDRRRVMLNASTDLPDMAAIYPTVTVQGDARCDRWKSFMQEVRYNAWP